VALPTLLVTANAVNSKLLLANISARMNRLHQHIRTIAGCPLQAVLEQFSTSLRII